MNISQMNKDQLLSALEHTQETQKRIEFLASRPWAHVSKSSAEDLLSDLKKIENEIYRHLGMIAAKEASQNES